METTIQGNVKVNKINKHVFVWVCNFLVGYLGVDRFARMLIKWTDFMHRPLYNYPKTKKEIST